MQTAGSSSHSKKIGQGKKHGPLEQEQRDAQECSAAEERRGGLREVLRIMVQDSEL